MLIYLTLVEDEEDKRKFVRLYERYKNLMFYIAHKIIQDNGLAEDIVHNSFIKVIHILDRIQEVDSVRTKNLLVLITENTAIDYYRKKKRENYISIDEVTEDELGIYQDTLAGYDRMEEMIAKLPVNYSQVLVLKYYHEWRDDEIAKILNISTDNVRKGFPGLRLN